VSELADVYEQLRDDVSALVSGLGPDELDTPVPATPGWTIKTIVAHLAADATRLGAGDVPHEFFAAPGDGDAIALLNRWTAGQIEERKDRPLRELLDEWKHSGDDIVAMMRNERPWPDGSLFFIDRVLVTDAAVHQQDVLGALGIEGARDGAGVKVGLSTYVAGVGLRLASSDLSPLRFDVGEKSYTAGDGDPGATVGASRFELFRALSGRRSPEQIAAYDWDGDARPYIPYFYPYGIREDALVE
jgi:uncharacterized protein (TIGR03083 family)